MRSKRPVLIGETLSIALDILNTVRIGPSNDVECCPWAASTFLARKENHRHRVTPHPLLQPAFSTKPTH